MAKGIELTFKGVNRVANPIRATAAKFPEIADVVMKQWAQNVRARLKGLPYPPKLPNQRYVRTGELANRWAAVRVKVGQWSITNARPSVEYVIDEEKQARIHEGRWYVAQAEIEKDRPVLVADLTAAFSKALTP